MSLPYKDFCFFSFSFFSSILFFGKPQKSLSPGDLQKWQRLELLFVLGFVVAGKQHVAVRATQEVRLFFRHVVLFVFFFPSVGVSPYDFFFEFSRKSDSAFACATEGEMCFTQNIRSRVTKKNKHRIVLFYASVSPLIRKNKLREQKKNVNTSINVHTHRSQN